jgi:dTDP-4-amino-4,6-dideoxygalactose transaminase
MSSQSIPVFKPLLEAEEIAAAVASLENGWLGMGASVGQFEEEVSRFLELDGHRHAVACSTGHAALHLALMLANVGPGDEVISASFNNIADFQAILAVGAKPVLCDISDQTLCIDLDEAEKLVGPNTKAIIGMDYACHFCDHERLGAFADKHGLRLIHDAAHSFGSRYKGKMAGSFADISIFSFDPVKNITCIDGGMVIVRSEEEVQALREMRLMGQGQPAQVMYQNRRAWTYDVKRLGFRYHLANLHAALGLAQMAKVERIRSTRQQAFAFYRDSLRGIPGLQVPDVSEKDLLPFIFYVRVTDDRREEFREYLSANGVDNGIHWQPGHWFSLLKECRAGDLSRTEVLGRQIVSLPFHSAMERETQEKVVEVVSSFFR